jgi:hypothetical protein
LAVVEVAAAALPLCSYHPPVTDLSNLEVSATYQYHEDPYGVSDRDVNAGQLSFAYTRLVDHPAYGFSGSVKNDMSLSTFNPPSYLLTGNARLRRYVAPDDVAFVFGGATGKVASPYEGAGISAEFGFGYGRFIDVTALAKAMRIDADLFLRKSISKHLDQATLKKIADVIADRESYKLLANLLRVLQDYVQQTGLTKLGGLDALDLFQMKDIVEDDQFQRYCGATITVGFTDELVSALGAPFGLLATGGVNFALAPSAEEQILARGGFSAGPDALRNHRLELSASYGRVIRDTIRISGSYSFSREIWDGSPTDICNLSVNTVLSLSADAQLSVGMRLGYETGFQDWSKDFNVLLSMDLL